MTMLEEAAKCRQCGQRCDRLGREDCCICRGTAPCATCQPAARAIDEAIADLEARREPSACCGAKKIGCWVCEDTRSRCERCFVCANCGPLIDELAVIEETEAAERARRQR